jgi:hypothetical protein
MPKTIGNELVTAARFIQYLKTLPANTPIVLSRDEEGNGYSPLSDFGVSGLQDVADLDLMERLDKKHKKALVLYPN